MISGVPQGTVLGPLLFLIMVDDINSSLIHSSATSFVDDTRIKRKIEFEEDTDLLQLDLERVISWAKENNMTLNGENFELLRYGGKKGIKSSTNYQCGQQVVPAKEQTKDLGVSMNNAAICSFYHYSNITQAAP